jgi:hypothetical protein
MFSMDWTGLDWVFTGFASNRVATWQLRNKSLTLVADTNNHPQNSVYEKHTQDR